MGERPLKGPLFCLRTRRPFRSFLLQRDCMLTVSGKAYYQDSLMRPPTGIENLDLKWLEYEDIDRIMYVVACAHVRLVSLLRFTQWVWCFGLWLKTYIDIVMQFKFEVYVILFASLQMLRGPVSCYLKDRPDTTEKRRTEWVAMLLTMRSRSGTLSISNLAVAFKLWFKQWCK